MKKSKIILIIILAVVVFVSAIVVWWQFDNIKAIYYGWKYSESDIKEMVKKNDDELNEFIKSNPEYKVHPITPLEEKLYQEGIIDDEELADMLTEKTTVEDMFGKKLDLSDKGVLIDSENGEQISTEKASQLKEERKEDIKEEASSQGKETSGSKPEANKPQSTGSDNKKDESSKTGSVADVGVGTGSSVVNNDSSVTGNASNSDSPSMGEIMNSTESADVSASIAQVYVLRSSMLSQLNDLYNQALAAYSALPDDQKASGMRDIISSLYSQAVSLEASCDAQMSQILSDLQSQISASGGDTSIVGKIQSAYQNEKSLQKAYYLNQG